MKIGFRKSWKDIYVSYVYGTEMGAIETEMPKFFLNRDYGDGVKEINFAMFCVNTEIFDGFDEEFQFDLKKRKI